MDPGRVPRRVPVRRTLLFILFLLSADSLSVSITLSSLFVCVWFQRRCGGGPAAHPVFSGRVSIIHRIPGIDSVLVSPGRLAAEP